MIAVLKEECSYGRNSHKCSNIGYFCKYCDQDCSANKDDCDHGRNFIMTKKHDIFVRIVIIIIVLINITFFGIAIMIAVLRNTAVIVL